MTFIRNLVAGAAIAASSLTTAQATQCLITDLTPTAQACAGFYDGNLLNNSAADVLAQTTALGLLGLTWNGSIVEGLSPLNGSHTIDFTTLLQGTSYVGIHFGNGQGGPGNATAFYRLDAGAGLDVINIAYNASSNARLYSTQVTAVPEPETYALMVAGLGVMGFVARRRRRARVV